MRFPLVSPLKEPKSAEKVYRLFFLAALGLVLAVAVTAASVDDAAAAPHVLAQLDQQRYPRVEVIWADNKYHNHDLQRWIETTSPGAWRLDIVRRPAERKGFVLLPKRWIVGFPCNQHKN
jgi:putative transposase